MEAPAKQDHFRCQSVSKTVNAHCHTRHCMHHMRQAKTTNFHCQHPPSLNGLVPQYVCWMQDTGPFHFFLDKILISLAKQFFLGRFHSSSNCINTVQQNIIVVLFFPRPAPTELCVSSSASNKETIGMAGKNIKPHLLRQKMKQYNNACMTDFPWHRREDDVDTGKSGVSAWPLFCKPCCAEM